MLRRLALTAFVASSALAADPRVVVVKSADFGAYAQLVAGFASEVKAKVEVVTLDEHAPAERVFRTLTADPPALVLAIGPAAAVEAKRAFTSVPVIFTMVPSFEKYGLDGSNTTGVALTSDLSLELEALRALRRSVKRVGVLHDPRYSSAYVASAAAAAKTRGLTLVGLPVDGPAAVERALSQSVTGLDALVIISDKTVGNAAVVERLLEVAAQRKIPAVGLAPAQVTRGALFALSAPPVSVGQHAARLANRVLLEKVDPGSMAVEPPTEQTLYVNLATARALGAGESLSEAVLRFAASKGLTVKVTED